MAKKVNIFLLVWAILMTFVAGGAVGFEAMRYLGKTNLESKSATAAPMMDQPKPQVVEASAVSTWQSDWVRYNGDVYDYNEDITTFLIMGIDKDDDIATEVPEGTDGGQADSLFLLVLNPHKNSVQIIGINRNAMTDVDIYDDNGKYQNTVVAQIATQHGFGNGMEESCQYQVKAVSNMFYQLPIHGYAAINMSAIPTLNDQVGGVDVEVLEDLTKFDKSLKKGEQVHLEGKQAYYYVKARDIEKFGSSDNRLERQRQYLNELIKAARDASSEDNNAAIEIFNAIRKKMVTNISADEVSFLAPYLTSYSFDSTDFRMIQGETEKNGEFEEFYVDEDDLYKTIIEVFYEKIDYMD